MICLFQLDLCHPIRSHCNIIDRDLRYLFGFLTFHEIYYKHHTTNLNLKLSHTKTALCVWKMQNSKREDIKKWKRFTWNLGNCGNFLPNEILQYTGNLVLRNLLTAILFGIGCGLLKIRQLLRRTCVSEMWPIKDVRLDQLEDLNFINKEFNEDMRTR